MSRSPECISPLSIYLNASLKFTIFENDVVAVLIAITAGSKV